mmetsp:Transcript_24658/g.53192  ORF Transcript_24658/g.53192 Transcript_24658/m.53192 type:complete len:553 (-) Transcript_24658:406-2064(-)
MDEITDDVGGLSMTAKEWRPGQGFAPTPNASSPSSSGSSAAAANATRQSSAGSAGSGGAWKNTGSGQSSWGEAEAPSQAIDVNGTHYFGSPNSSRHPHHPSAAQSSLNDNTSHTNTTIPSHNNQQHRTPRRSTLSNALSLPMEEYHHHRELSLQSAREMEPNDPRHKAVPPSFCRAYCLDNRHENDTGNNNTITQQRSSFGYPSSLFRVTSATDGNLYCLRRIDSVRCVSHKIAQTVMHQWLSNASGREKHNNNGGFDHPGVVRWYKCFLSQRAVFFVHQYHAGAVTLRERFFSHAQQQGQGGGGGVPLPESLIWSCLVQLVSAIRAVHGNNLAVRSLQLNHILCTQENIMSGTSSSGGPYGLPKLRLRINCIGIVDILEFEARKGLEDLQSADMRALGCILLSMTTGTEINVNDIYRNNTVQQQAQILMEYLQFVQQNYSREMYVLVHSLLNPNAPPSSIRGIAGSMAMRAFDELDGAHGCIDEMHGALAGIYESGRAMRLLLKLAFVNERPEFGIDKNWSESGDCYILKLFRDFGEYYVRPFVNFLLVSW